jgi:hypothetical protein
MNRVDLALTDERSTAELVRSALLEWELEETDRPILDALIEVSLDEDVRVVGWATTGLAGSQDLKNPRIRDALLARVDDADPETRGEVLIGLARRNSRVAGAPPRRWNAAGPEPVM